MSFSLLTLLDDVASTLDDIAAMTKIAAKKTSAILGDDLALNAEQLTGIASQRELPVIWAVSKGSLINKAILVPFALLFSFIYPPMITYLLIIGGLYLCFEGAEKIIHKKEQPKKKQPKDLATTNINQLEKKRVRGAIRTDFILSAEIIIIILGSIKDYPFYLQVITLVLFSILLTFFVYGVVAAIVRLDDAGIALMKRPSILSQKVGMIMIQSMPYVMKSLSVIGTIAMFFVGGGILSHSISFFHHQLTLIEQSTSSLALHWLVETFAPATLGLIAGLILLLITTSFKKIFFKKRQI